MNNKRCLLQASNLLLILVLLVACSAPPTPKTNVPPTETDIPAEVPSTSTESLTDKAEIIKIVTDAGKIIAPEELKDPDIPQNITSEDGKTQYVDTTYHVKDNIDSILYLGLNDDIIWPANLVKGSEADKFVYEPIIVARAPVTLSLSLESSLSTGPSITQVVDDPKLSTIRQGISNLIKNGITGETKVPARVEFNYERVYNESQLNLVLGTDIKYGAGKLNTKFNWDSNTKKTKIMAVYKQIYYSIDVDTPMSPADFIAPSMTATELSTAMPMGSMPMYIASVSYGMMALMFIETDESEDTIKAALEAGYSGVEVKGDLDVKEILGESSIKIIVYGGSTANLKNLETGYDGFKKVIEASSDFGPQTPGVPILYKFRNLTDNTLALTTLESDYTVRTEYKVDQQLCGPFGGEGGSNATTLDLREKRGVEGIRVSYSSVVDGIEIRYRDGTVNRYGGTGGKTTVINLGSDEYIKEITLWWGNFKPGFFHNTINVIKAIKIITNKDKTYGPFGNQDGDTKICGGPEWKITGLIVRSGRYLDSLGIYYQKP